MNRKATFGVVASLLFGVWGILFGLSARSQSESPNVPVSAEAAPNQPASTEAADDGLHYDVLIRNVVPGTGITLSVNWGDMGQELIKAGAIDLEKFEANYNGLNEEQKAILLGEEMTDITFRPDNIQFWTNVLWAFGLTQQSMVLEEGPIQQYEAQTPLGNYASTGGWTLGRKPATELYNSARLVRLTPEQDALVYRVAENVFRPCCGNHTAFPDCNHGMAVLGLLEMLAAQGADEVELYKAALAFNVYAFSDTYISVAAYFAMQGTSWSDVSAREVLGPEYSSGQGARQIAAAVGPIPGAPGQGGSCAA